MKKQGISLIVLTITILVMIILAAVLVITLNNGGVINKANEAVNTTNLKQVQELAQVIWAEGYLNGDTTDKIQEEIEKQLGDAASKYKITVTDKGVTVKKEASSTEIREYYDDPSVVPTKAEYFTYNYDKTTMTATVTGAKNRNIIAYYYGESYGRTGEFSSQHSVGDEEGNVIRKIVIPYETVDENGDVYTVTAIGEYAFHEYATIEEIILPNTITSIGGRAFDICWSLKSITIPTSVTVISSYVISNLHNSSLTIHYMGSRWGWNNLLYTSQYSELKNVNVICKDENYYGNGSYYDGSMYYN